MCMATIGQLYTTHSNNSICYHIVREAVASGELLTTHCKTGYNQSNMMTKVLYGQKKQDNVSRDLYDIYDNEDGLSPVTE